MRGSLVSDILDEDNQYIYEEKFRIGESNLSLCHTSPDLSLTK
jgi:hypothetical protein